MKFAIVAIAIFAFPILIGYGAPVNETKALAEEINELKRNLSLVWKFLAILQSRVDVIEKPDLALLHLPPCQDIEEKVTDHGDQQPTSRGEDDEKEEEGEDDDDENDEDEKKDHKDDNDEDEKKSHKDENEKKSHQDENDQRSKDGRSLVEKRREKVKEKCFFNNGRYMQPFDQPITPSYETTNYNTNVTAFCSLRPNKAFPPEKRMDVRGKVYMTEKDTNTLIVTLSVSGIQPSKSSMTVSQSLKHGFHVHQFGNLNNGCESAGGHFNPFNISHGSPDSKIRHFGDLGNIETDSLGNINKTIEFKLNRALTGPNSFIGKAIVIHEKVDDLGSNPSDTGSITTGNSGSRLACCVLHKLE